MLHYQDSKAAYTGHAVLSSSTVRPKQDQSLSRSPCQSSLVRAPRNHINTKDIEKIDISGIHLVLGIGTKVRDPSVSVVFWAPIKEPPAELCSPYHGPRIHVYRRIYIYIHTHPFPNTCQLYTIHNIGPIQQTSPESTRGP